MKGSNITTDWSARNLRNKYPKRFVPYSYTEETEGNTTTFGEVEVACVLKKVREKLPTISIQDIDAFIDPNPKIALLSRGSNYTFLSRITKYGNKRTLLIE